MTGCLCIKEGTIDIYVLPDNARCLHTLKNPMEMDECPMKRFDSLGMVCMPGECEGYTEDDDIAELGDDAE